AAIEAEHCSLFNRESNAVERQELATKGFCEALGLNRCCHCLVTVDDPIEKVEVSSIRPHVCDQPKVISRLAIFQPSDVR
ncbi:MAG: hypothetical protein RL486_686, partial [Actinomycetota bacterium]